MAKAVTLVRVSTKKQSFDEQSRIVYDMAVNDGYDPNDIIQIEEKESGYLDEDDRRGLNKLKNVLDGDNTINCVYAWEVSRVARKKKVGFSILDYLSNKEINLKIYNPRLELLNADGTINEGMETLFTLYLQFAESELRTMKARFKRTIEAKKRQGYVMNNKPKWGYKLNKGKAIIDEEQAKLVRLMFTLYSQQTPTAEIVRQLNALGKRTDKNHMLTDIHFPYYGNNVYPPIISKELWDECQALCQERMTYKQRDSHRIYFGKSILKCSTCKHVMSTNTNNLSYQCRNEQHINFSINGVDSCLWHVSKILYGGAMAEHQALTKQKYDEAMEQYDKSIEQYNKQIKRLNNQKDTLEESFYVDGKLTKEKFEKFLSDIESKINSCENEIKYFIKKIEDLDRTFQGQTARGYSVEELDNLDDTNKQQICIDMIEWAECVKLSKSEFILHVYPKSMIDKISFKINMYKKEVTSEDIYMGNFNLMCRFSKK